MSAFSISLPDNISRLDWVASKSLINCHTKNVDSIVFVDPTILKTDSSCIRLIRAFCAHSDHDLWKNAAPLKEELSVAVHSHHCDIIMQPNTGYPHNVLVKPDGHLTRLKSYRYESAIKASSGKFVDMGITTPMSLQNIELVRMTSLKAETLHTVYVPKGQSASWYIFEGQEDPNYVPICHSNTNLEEFDFSELYKPMSADYAEYLIAKFSLMKYF